MFAYTDDFAAVCLGYSDIRSTLDIVEYWSVANSIELNKKKRLILSVYRKSVLLVSKKISDVPFVCEYKYLGYL